MVTSRVQHIHKVFTDVTVNAKLE